MQARRPKLRPSRDPCRSGARAISGIPGGAPTGTGTVATLTAAHLRLTPIPDPAGRLATVGKANLALALGPGDTAQGDWVDLRDMAHGDGVNPAAEPADMAPVDRVDPVAELALGRADRVLDADQYVAISRAAADGNGIRRPPK